MDLLQGLMNEAERNELVTKINEGLETLGYAVAILHPNVLQGAKNTEISSVMSNAGVKYIKNIIKAR